MYHGANGRVLQIALPQKVVKEKLDPKLTHMFLGGLGFNARILHDEVGPGVDPLSPENIVVISPGALNGTGAPTACRTEVTTKSPLTGILGTGNLGGYWGQALKNAGYDTIVIRNRSPEPVYLLVDDDHVEIREVHHLWGKDTWDTSDILKEELGEDFSVLSIGQTGENLVRYASVIVDYHHAAGRSHAGAVLGAKKLKAIAVRGTGRPAVKSPDKFEKAVREAVDRIENYPGWGFYEAVGPLAIVAPEYAEIAEQYLIKGPERSFCPCMMGSYVGCTLTTEIKEGKYKGTKILPPGLGNCAGIAKILGISLPAAFKLQELHNRYGLDYWGNPLTFVLNLYQNGIITKTDTDGLELVRGNETAIIELLGKIANREGFGAIIAEGTSRASRMIGRGSEEHVTTVKGLEFAFDPRVRPLVRALSVLINPRGGDDLKGTHGLVDYARTPGLPAWARKLNWEEDKYLDWLLNRLDIFEDVKKVLFGSPPKLNDVDAAMLTKWYNDLTCVFNSLGLCMFSDSFSVLGPTLYSDLYSAYTGRTVTPVELMATGERIFNIMRAYNVREGMKREQDHWPRRFYEKPLIRKEGEIYSLSKERIDQLLNRYYELRGWDIETGVPTQGKLRELQLYDVADDLLKLGY